MVDKRIRSYAWRIRSPQGNYMDRLTQPRRLCSHEPEYTHISIRSELCIDKTRDVSNYSKSQNTRPRKVRAPSCSTMHSRVSNIDSIRAPPSGVTHRFISSVKHGSPSTHIHKEVHRLFD